MMIRDGQINMARFDRYAVDGRVHGLGAAADATVDRMPMLWVGMCRTMNTAAGILGGRTPKTL
jgi:hypothetical protein